MYSGFWPRALSFLSTITIIGGISSVAYWFDISWYWSLAIALPFILAVTLFDTAWRRKLDQ